MTELNFSVNDLFVHDDVDMKALSIEEMEDLAGHALLTYLFMLKLWLLGWVVASASPSGEPGKYDAYKIRVMPGWWSRGGRFRFYINGAELLLPSAIHHNVWQHACQPGSHYPLGRVL